MDLVDLKMFEAVTAHGSMNRAARALHTVQSNVTTRIGKLEDQLGVALFERSRRGVTLTAPGARLLPYARHILALMGEAERAVRDDGPPHGPLRIGSLETTAALRLPDVLAAYAGACPAVSLTVTTGTSSSLTLDVVERRLDAAFVAGPVSRPDIDSTVAFVEELVIAAPARLGKLEKLSSVDEMRTIVFRAGCTYRLRLEEWLARRGRQLVSPLEFGSLEAILGCVAAGVGMTMLPRIVVERVADRSRIAILELPGEEARVETVLIRRRDAYVSGALRAFETMVKQQGLHQDRPLAKVTRFA